MKISPKRQLAVAQWWRPDIRWNVDLDGEVFSRDILVDEGRAIRFDISTASAQGRVITKLKRDHNIDIEKRTKDGTPYWEAISQDAPNMRGSHKHSDLGELLVQIIEGLTNG